MSLNADYRAEEVYVGAQFIGLSGSDTLGDDALVSHGVTFPAGSRLSESTDLNWYRVGYRHRFDLLGDGSLTLSPGVGVDFLDFSTRLSGGGTTTSRSYIKPGVQLALATEWRPNDGPFSLELDLLGSPGQFQSLAAIFSEELVAKYRFVDRGRVQVGGFVGVGFEQIRFEDSQRTPNRINVDLGPSLIVGVSVAF